LHWKKLLPFSLFVGLVVGIIGIPLGWISTSRAAESSEEGIKAAFIYNFIRYIEWPNEAGKTNFELAYLGSSATMFTALRKLQGNRIKNVPIKVKRVSSPDELLPADLVLVDGDKLTLLRNINTLIKDSPVLIISDQSKEKQLFGINFFRTEQQRMGFEINRYNLVYQQLKVSPDIVILGGTEIEIATMVKEMEADLEKGRSQLAELLSQVDVKQKKLDEQTEKLSSQQQRLFDLDMTIRSQKTAYDKLQTEFAQLSESLLTSRLELDQNNQLLGTKQAELAKKSAAIDDLANLINRNKQLLLEQNQRLTEQREELSQSQQQLETQKVALEKQSHTIQAQSKALYAMILLIISVGITILMVYRGFKIKQKSNEALERKNKQLEDINYQLTNTRDQLVEAEKMAALGGLVAGVAHEINTPIGVGVTSASHLMDSLRGFEKKYQSGDLKRSELEALLQDLNESGNILERNLRRASALIRSFKQVSADQTNEEIRQFKLLEYLGEIVQNLHHKLKQKNHRVELEGESSLTIRSYPGVFAQIFTNLIVNSIIHGFGEHEHGVISIATERQNDQVVIRYRDNGKGIPDDQRDKVFNPFFTTNRQQGGTGLGLHICFNLITQRLRGSIQCEQSDCGALFVVTLPIVRPTE